MEIKLHINTKVLPLAQKAGQIPFHLCKKVVYEPKILEEQHFIERVNGPTPWVSPLVMIQRKLVMSACVDMQMANKAIIRQSYPTPTIDDLIHILNGATVFSKSDLQSGYCQVTLTPKSRHFATHQQGLWRYCRLNFGTNSASKTFQKLINELIHDIPKVLNISDDVIIFWQNPS